MAHSPSIRALALFSLVLPIGACSPLSPQEPPDVALWVPNAEPGFVTIDRSTTYAIKHAPDTDLLIFEVEDNPSSHKPTMRLTWLIEVKSGAPTEKSLELGEGKFASGWLVEQVAGKPTHAAPLAGTINISQRSTEAVTGVVNVYAITSKPTAGEAAGGRVRLARRIEWQHHSHETYESREPETRGGLTQDEQQAGTDKQPK